MSEDPPAPKISIKTGQGQKPPEDRLLSPITRRILAVNVLALAILATGILYLDEYKRKLIETELAALNTHAEMFAAALAEGAVTANSPSSDPFVRRAARQMMGRLVESSKARARLFATDGHLILDSRLQAVSTGAIIAEDLPPPVDRSSIFGQVFDYYDEFTGLIPNSQPLPKYREPEFQQATDYAEVLVALGGQRAGMVRVAENGSLVLSVAVPVQRYKHILGSLMLSSNARKIEQAIFEIRLDILRVFLVSLMVTTLLSLYLAGTIARPIMILSQAAERVRRGLSRQDTIPDLTRRADEIGTLSGALRDMTEALWTRMDAIENFAADVAHELKNPLTSLRSAVETVSRIQNPEQRAQLMDIIQQDVVRLDRLISDISDASRLDAELSRAHMESVDLRLLLETLEGTYNSTAAKGRAKLRLVLPDNGDGVKVLGLEGRLGQVFRNLIDNAISFSPPKGDIALRVENDGATVTIKVEDQGPGLPEGTEEKIFKRFYTERPDGEDFGTHSGLGLSISKQIVEAQGGTLVAENRLSEDGQKVGARFVVTLPVAPKEKPDKASVTDRVKNLGKRREKDDGKGVDS